MVSTCGWSSSSQCRRMPSMRSTRHRIAPRVIPNVAGQFSIPARLEGRPRTHGEPRSRSSMSATSDSATNRTYAEEAFFFVPMLLSDGLRRAGEYVAALDWARTVYDYASSCGQAEDLLRSRPGGDTAGGL